MTEIRIDWSDLERVVAELERKGSDLGREVRPTVFKGAMNVKESWQSDFHRSAYFSQVARTINFDIESDRTGTEAEVGPELTGTGSPAYLAHIAHFGGANGGGGTIPDPERHLDKELPYLEKAIGDILEGLL